MLSDQERRQWDEIERSWEVLTWEPGPEAPKRADEPGAGRPDLPAAVVAGSWAVILLTLVGQMDAVLVVGLVTALYWGLWRLTRLRT